MIHLKSGKQTAALATVLASAEAADIKHSHLTISQRNSGGLRVATTMQAVDIEPDGTVHPENYGWQLELK